MSFLDTLNACFRVCTISRHRQLWLGSGLDVFDVVGTCKLLKYMYLGHKLWTIIRYNLLGYSTGQNKIYKCHSSMARPLPCSCTHAM